MKYKYGEPNKYGEFPYLYSGTYKQSELRAILEERLPEYYNIEIVDPIELEILTEIVNQGIDSHLEAVTSKDNGKVVNVKAGDKVVCRKFQFIPDKSGMLCLLRRLEEYIVRCEDDLKWEPAYQLLSCIYETLGIEFNL